MCDTEFEVNGGAVKLLTPLDTNAWVKCTGSHNITTADIDELERKSGATATAVDEYDYVVQATAAVKVELKQVPMTSTKRV